MCNLLGLPEFLTLLLIRNKTRLCLEKNSRTGRTVESSGCKGPSISWGLCDDSGICGRKFRKRLADYAEETCAAVKKNFDIDIGDTGVQGKHDEKDIRVVIQ